VQAATKSKAVTAQLVEWTEYLAAGGLASVPGQAEPALIPWRAIEEIVTAQNGTPPSIREFLGVDLAARPREVEVDLHARFPDLPPDVFGRATAPYLPREPGVGGGGGGGGSFDPGDRRPGSRPSVGGMPVITPAPKA